MLLIVFTLFIFGLAVGSFINVLSDSLTKGKSFLFRRSRCDHCKKTLGPIDLIPFFGFFLLGGKCRFCKKKISWQYPLVELACGVLAMLSLWYVSKFPASLWLSVFLLLILNSLFYILASLFIIDLKYGLVPDVLVFPGIAISFLFLLVKKFLLGSADSLLLIVVGSLAGALFFWFLRFITKGKGMGEGDIFLALLVGLLTGFPGMLVAFSTSFLTGGLVGVILIIAQKKTMKETIPFGPFIIFGALLTLCFGEKIIGLLFPFPFLS